MKKKMVKVLLAFVMVLSMVCMCACGGNKDNDNKDNDKNTENVGTEQDDKENQGGSSESVSNSDADEYVFAVKTEAGKDLALKMVIENGNQGNPDGTWELSEAGSVVKKGTFETDTYMFVTFTAEDASTVMGIFERTESYDVTAMIFDTDYVKFNREGQSLYDYGNVTMKVDSFVIDGKEYDGSLIQSSGAQGGGQSEDETTSGKAYTAKVQISVPEYTGELSLTLTLSDADKTFTLKDKWGNTDVSGTYEISNFVVLKLTTTDGAVYTGCIQTDESYNETGIIFDKTYDNGYDMAWTDLLDFGSVTFSVAE